MDTKNVQSSIQLIGTSIVALNIRNDLVVYGERMDGKKTIDVSYAVRDIRLSNDPSRKSGVLDLSVVLSAEINGSNFSLEMTMRGFFEIDAACDDVRFTEILEINGCAALYSMARASISCISTQMFSVGNIVLPMVNFIHFRKLQEQEKTNSD